MKNRDTAEFGAAEGEFVIDFAPPGSLIAVRTKLATWP